MSNTKTSTTSLVVPSSLLTSLCTILTESASFFFPCVWHPPRTILHNLPNFWEFEKKDYHILLVIFIFRMILKQLVKLSFKAFEKLSECCWSFKLIQLTTLPLNGRTEVVLSFGICKSPFIILREDLGWGAYFPFSASLPPGCQRLLKLNAIVHLPILFLRLA